VADPFTPYYYRDADELPSSLNIPARFRQNETPSWNDDEYEDANGNLYAALQYTLTYVLAGASAAPVSLTAAAASNTTGWTTSITPTKAALLLPGAYWWQAVLTATNFRLVAGEGQLTIEVDLGALAGVYDGRTTAQKALTACENALATFSASGGAIRRYTIGSRSMEFQNIQEITALMSVWRTRVAAEISTACRGADRKLLARWSRAH
jgi:hypothetical protein